MLPNSASPGCPMQHSAPSGASLDCKLCSFVTSARCPLTQSPPVPQHINPVAANLIQKMLRSDPATRPTIDELLNDEFFTSGYLPGRLPTSCLTIAPRFSLAPSSMELSSRKPLTALNKGRCGCPGEAEPAWPPAASTTVSDAHIISWSLWELRAFVGEGALFAQDEAWHLLQLCNGLKLKPRKFHRT